MWLARCTDTLLWVVDLNGGGIATPWIEPWAMGRAPRPVVDWVADSEAEMAVMVAVAGAIARDRKSNAAARRRKRAAGNGVLPVDEGMPAIVVLADEGGEIRQAMSLLGIYAANGLTRLAQIGRAEGVRPLISILRGTSDLLDKAHRTQVSQRLCLRMNETDEYGHVLGDNPGKAKLQHVGSGYLRTIALPDPVYGRTVNVDEASIEGHAIACANLRPDLDADGLRTAAALKSADVTGGKTYPDLARTQVMRDVAAGRAYTGRWDRYEAKLREMCGEVAGPARELDEDPPAESAAPAPVGVSSTGAIADLVNAMARYAPPSTVTEEDESTMAGKPPTRELITAILSEQQPLTSGQIGMELARRQASVKREYRQEVLRKMREAGEVEQDTSRAYRLRRAS
jgi:hypothetical protein